MKTNNPMNNQRESLADIVITPALQEAGLPPTAPHRSPQVTDSTSDKTELISCPDEAGDQSECQNPAKPAQKMPSQECVSIPLTKGLSTLVDARDWGIATSVSWSAQETTHGTYAKGWKDGGNVYLHRLIFGLKRGDKRVVDHINGDTLDNRRSNLRVTDRTGNARNRKRNIHREPGSFKGVRRAGIRHIAQIGHMGERIRLGSFPTAVEAAYAYDRAARELFGEFAWLNFPEAPNE